MNGGQGHRRIRYVVLVCIPGEELPSDMNLECRFSGVRDLCAAYSRIACLVTFVGVTPDLRANIRTTATRVRMVSGSRRTRVGA